MKHFALILLAALTWSVSTQITAQCTADFDFMGAGFGISPSPALGETFVDGSVYQSYTETIHIIIPSNTADIPDAPIELELDSVVLDSILLIGELGEAMLTTDIGLALFPNNNGDSGNPNAFLGGGQYCANLEGTPDTVGVFTGAIYTTAWVTVPFLGANAIPFPFEGYTLTINPEPIPGCMDEIACNYDPYASDDDGSCFFTCPGCTDPVACNFDDDANFEDGSCEYAADFYDCDGNCFMDSDGDGVCDELEVAGCTDLTACNYDETATDDDGSCFFAEDFYDCDGNCLNDSDLDGQCDEIQDVLFMESFGNGFHGWTTEDNVGDSVWIYVQGLGGSFGYGQYSDGSSTGAVHPAGEFSTAFGPLLSETQADGWMIFDADYFNTPVSNGHVDLEGSLTSPFLDFSAESSMVVEWVSYFRYCCFQYAPLFLDVGVTEDGQTIWTEFDGHGDFIESGNTASANPYPVEVDISCAAAHKDSVQIRFAYRQPEETGNGYSHYYWGIDDVFVRRNVVEHDVVVSELILANSQDMNVFSGWEYSNVPLGLAEGSCDGGLDVTFTYENVGTTTETGAQVVVSIRESSGVSVFEHTEDVSVIYAAGDVPSCPAQEVNSYVLSTGWTPAGPGDYDVDIEVLLPEDADPSNNALSKSITYTQGEYGHEREALLDGELRARASDEEIGSVDPTGYGSFFFVPYSGAVAEGVTVMFGPNCGLSRVGNVEDLVFNVEILENPTSPYSSNYAFDGTTVYSEAFVFDPTWANPGVNGTLETELDFQTPFVMNGGSSYFVSVIQPEPSLSELTVLAESSGNTDNSTGKYSQTGDGDFAWFSSQQSTPAIRLRVNTDDVATPVCYGCTVDVACNYDPYASDDDGSCFFTCPGCTDPVACNFDDDANFEDGSCEYLTCAGCTQPEACNYDLFASIDNGQCLFLDECGVCGGPGAVYACGCSELPSGECDCDGNTIDDCGVCGGDNSTCTGCTYPNACNYDASAIILDVGLCIFGECGGCLDQSACNYNPTVAFDDGTCAYDVDAIGVCGGTCQADTNGNGVCDVEESCLGDFDECGVCDGPGAVYACGCQDVPSGDCDCDGNVLDALGVCGGECLFDLDGDGLCDEVLGCTYAIAVNYNPLASVDDGSCLFDGLDDACGLLHDSDNDGAVGTTDLLDLLTEFGQSCD